MLICLIIANFHACNKCREAILSTGLEQNMQRSQVEQADKFSVCCIFSIHDLVHVYVPRKWKSSSLQRGDMFFIQSPFLSNWSDKFVPSQLPERKTLAERGTDIVRPCDTCQ